jgi:hypothetical protein
MRAAIGHSLPVGKQDFDYCVAWEAALEGQMNQLPASWLV